MSIIVAGWDKHKGGQVFAIPVEVASARPFAIGGSGSTYIYGFCDAYYRPGMNAQQCEEFVAKALCHAMARDGSSGGVIRTVRIDESGVERKMIPGSCRRAAESGAPDRPTATAETLCVRLASSVHTVVGLEREMYGVVCGCTYVCAERGFSRSP